MMKKEEVLKRTPILAGLSGGAFRHIVRIAEIQRFDSDELIFSEGDEAHALYVLVEGRIDLVKISMEGVERLVRTVQRGETFAEAAMFSGEQFPVTAIARMKGQMIMIPKDRFLRCVQDHPEVALLIMGSMAKLLRHWNALLSELSLSTVEERLGTWLLKRSQEAGSPSFDLGLPKKELAFKLGTIPETLSRTFKKLIEAGGLKMQGGRVTLKDLKKLQARI